VIEKDYKGVAEQMKLDAEDKRQNTKECLEVALEGANRKMFRLNLLAKADMKRRDRRQSMQ
jgi:hypothetical protein